MMKREAVLRGVLLNSYWITSVSIRWPLKRNKPVYRAVDISNSESPDHQSDEQYEMNITFASQKPGLTEQLSENIPDALEKFFFS